MNIRERDRREMEGVVRAAPGYLYTYAPEPGDKRFVFDDTTCLGLREAYEHAVHLHHTKGRET